MGANAERIALTVHYGKNSPFARKLKSMPDTQVIAIYLRLKKKGEIK